MQLGSFGFLVIPVIIILVATYIYTITSDMAVYTGPTNSTLSTATIQKMETMKGLSNGLLILIATAVTITIVMGIVMYCFREPSSGSSSGPQIQTAYQQIVLEDKQTGWFYCVNCKFWIDLSKYYLTTRAEQILEWEGGHQTHIVRFFVEHIAELHKLNKPEKPKTIVDKISEKLGEI